MGPDNVRNRILRPAIKRANDHLEDQGKPPVPTKLTPHGLRRTFLSLLYAIGESPATVMAEAGHKSPALALRVYAQSMRRGEDETAQIQALIEGEVLANGGQRDKSETTTTKDREVTTS